MKCSAVSLKPTRMTKRRPTADHSAGPKRLFGPSDSSSAFFVWGLRPGGLPSPLRPAIIIPIGESGGKHFFREVPCRCRFRRRFKLRWQGNVGQGNWIPVSIPLPRNSLATSCSRSWRSSECNSGKSLSEPSENANRRIFQRDLFSGIVSSVSKGGQILNKRR